MNLETKYQSIVIEIEKRRLTLLDRKSGQRMLIIPDLYLFQPVINGHSADLKFDRIEKDKTNGSLKFYFYASPEVSDFILTISPDNAADSIDFYCEFRTTGGCQLNSINFFPADTIVNMYNLVNFRNRHHTPEVFPELLTGQKIKTDTYSCDWQFAPHPTFFIFRKLQSHLFFGALDLPKTFGMYLEMKTFRVKNWSLDYGAHPNGRELAAGEMFRSPVMRLFLRKSKSVYGIIDEFVSMLVRSKRIPDPLKKTIQPWWRETIYCTWGDQWMGAKAKPPEELQEQANCSTLELARAVLTEKMVLDASDIIARYGLPIRTILIDEGWSVARGQWEPHPVRFPNFRQMVDILHQRGFRVMVWWNWAEIEDVAEVNPAHLMAGGKLSKHGRRVRDYSKPETQEEYLKPLMRKLFSNESDCYDLDGVKTDFLADKVHADMPVHDPAWRGEENYFYHVTRLFYGEMRKHKNDAMHMGCCGNFWLSEYMDTNRTYDVHNSNYLEHEERGRMLKHTAPGPVVSYDMHMLENFEKFLASARKNKAAIQVGNLFHIQDDWFSKIRPADKKYYKLLQKVLRS